ncbi:MAG: hypothetical protein QOH01_2057 [Verrucomicrobiota bacterium]|jgi:hypothetical protein
MKIVPRTCVAAVAGVLLLTRIASADEPSLLDIQKILAGKKFVDLTHAFAPGIPHWHGFPEEKRETAYWYEKGKGSIGEGFSPRFTRTWANGGRTSIRRLISSAACAPWTRSASRK